jgi:hypothetical protein
LASQKEERLPGDGAEYARGKESVCRKILACATLGSGSSDETRLLTLLRTFVPGVIPFDRGAKGRSCWRIFQTIWRERPDLVVMEGTGLAGGVALLLARWLAGIPYVISSGDAVGPFVARQAAWAGPFFHLYERLLCRWSAGFIGWTPYLVGRALTFGAPRAMTAAGFAPYRPSEDERAAGRRRVRTSVGIPPDAVVFGLVGSLAWNRRAGYCYGWELVNARLRVQRPDVKVLVVGDGSGLPQLRAVAGDRLGKDIYLLGRVPQEQVPACLAAMDIVSLPQSLDQVGSFRYTTKLSEYLSAGLPVVTGQLPLAYDLDEGWLWRLPGRAPWDKQYIDALTTLMSTLTPEEYRIKKQAVPIYSPEFDRERQVCRVTTFVQDLLRLPENSPSKE